MLKKNKESFGTWDKDSNPSIELKINFIPCLAMSINKDLRLFYPIIYTKMVGLLLHTEGGVFLLAKRPFKVQTVDKTNTIC